MTITAVKKIIQIGGSLAITLPKEWAKDHVKPGDEMYIVATDELHIAKVPQHRKPIEEIVEEKEEEPFWLSAPAPFADKK